MMRLTTAVWLAATTLALAQGQGAEPGDLGRVVLDLVNVERRAAGVDPLVWDDALAEAAALHSDDMAARGELSHEGGDGSRVGRRARAAGFAWRMIGENVAAGPSTAEAAVAGWMASPEHRENILDPGFAATGAATATAEDAYGRYWTQVFAR